MDLAARRTATGWKLIPAPGRLDAHTAPEFEAHLMPQLKGAEAIALDLGHLDYLSSAGLRVLLAALKSKQAEGGRMALLRPRGSVQEVLELTGFTALFPLYADERELP